MKLDILGTQWDAQLGQVSSADSGQMRFGFMDAEDHSITIHHDTDPTWRLYLLLHEVIHALTFLGHMQFLRHDDHPGHDDESKVDAIASLLAEFLLRNDLIKEGGVDKLFDE